MSWTLVPLLVPDASTATQGWLRERWLGVPPPDDVEPGVCASPRLPGLGLSRTLEALGPYQAAVRSSRPLTPITLVMPAAKTTSMTRATAIIGLAIGEPRRPNTASAPHTMRTISQPSRLKVLKSPRKTITPVPTHSRRQRLSVVANK